MKAPDGFWVLSAQAGTPKFVTPVVSNILDGTFAITWADVATATLSDEGSGWTGYTVRQVINSAGLSNTGNPNTRVTFQAAPSGGMTIYGAYIGHAAASGDPYDFESTPTQLLFSGVGTFSIAAGASIVSDTLLFTIQASKNLIISYRVSSSYLRRRVTNTNWQGYHKNADDMTTVNASGYSLGAEALGISKIESGVS